MEPPARRAGHGASRSMRLVSIVLLALAGLASTAGPASAAGTITNPHASTGAETYGCGSGAWPWNNEPWYLNRFIDPSSSTGYCIAPNQFSGSYTFQPDGTNTLYMEADVDIASGATATLPSNATWLGCGCTLTVDGDLEMAAGTTMEMSQNGSGILVNGKLDANGIPGATPGSGAPVTFTAVNASGGGMQYGIAFLPGSTGTLNDAIVEAGGGAHCPGESIEGSLLAYCLGSSDAQPPVLENSLIECHPTGQGCGNGVEVISGTPVLANDAMNNFGWFAAVFDAVPTAINMTGLSATNDNGDFTGGDKVVVPAGSYSGTGTWTVTGLPVQVSGGSLDVPAGTDLTLGAGMTFTSNTTVEGTLNVAGTATQPVTINDTGQNTSFSATGGGTWTHARLSSVEPDVRTAGGPLSISNSSFSRSSGGPLIEVAAGSVSGPTLTGDSFTLNDQRMPEQYDGPPTNMPATTFKLKLSSTGTPYPFVYVQTGTPYSGIGTWARQSIPIAVNFVCCTSTFTIPAGSALTVAAGNKLEAGGGYQVSNGNIDVLGTLNLKGTASSPVTVSSLVPANSFGPNIAFESGSKGTITFLMDTYGSWGGSSTCSMYAAINICGGSPSIKNSTIEYSGADGLDVTPGSTPTLRYNTFDAPGCPRNCNPTYAVNDVGWQSGDAVLNASHNFWGSNSGPTNPGNPGGSGSPVSSGVNFGPFLATKLSASSGAQSSQITVTGTGYAANETVTILWNCATLTCHTGVTTLGTAVAGANGSFSHVVTIPSGSVGNTYAIGAKGDTSNAFTEAPFQITS